MKVGGGGDDINSSYPPQESKKISVTLKTGRSAELKFINDGKSSGVNTIDGFFSELHWLTNKEVTLDELVSKLKERERVSAGTIEGDLTAIIDDAKNQTELKFIRSRLKEITIDCSSIYQSPEEIRVINKINEILKRKVTLINEKLKQGADSSNPSEQTGAEIPKTDRLRLERQLQPVFVKLGIMVLRAVVESPEKTTLGKALAWRANPRPAKGRAKEPSGKKPGKFLPSESRFREVLQAAFPRELKQVDKKLASSSTTQSSADKPSVSEGNRAEVTHETNDSIEITTTDVTNEARSGERAAKDAKSLVADPKDSPSLKKTEEPMKRKLPQKPVPRQPIRENQLLNPNGFVLFSGQPPAQAESAKKLTVACKVRQPLPYHDELLQQLEALLEKIEAFFENKPGSSEQPLTPKWLSQQFEVLIKPAVEKFIWEEVSMAQEKDHPDPCGAMDRITKQLDKLKKLAKKLQKLMERPNFTATVDEMLPWLRDAIERLEPYRIITTTQCLNSKKARYQQSETARPLYI